MKVLDAANGGGTDAAFAALKTKGAVIEGFGLSGFGAAFQRRRVHSDRDIAPRLYLTAD